MWCGEIISWDSSSTCAEPSEPISVCTVAPTASGKSVPAEIKDVIIVVDHVTITESRDASRGLFDARLQRLQWSQDPVMIFTSAILSHTV